MITTHEGEKELGFSSKTGVVFGNDRFVLNTVFPGSANDSYTNPVLTQNEFYYSNKAAKSFIGSSFSFTQNDVPSVAYKTPDMERKATSTFNRYRFSNFGGYQFNEKLKLDGGLFFTSQNRANTNKETIYAARWGNLLMENKINYIGAHAGLYFVANDRVQNILRVEGNQYKLTGSGDNQSNWDNTNSIFYKSEGKSKILYYSISNQFVWKPLVSQNLNLQASLLLRYYQNKTSTEGKSRQWTSRGDMAFSESQAKSNASSFSGTPNVTMTLKEILTTALGITYEDYKNSLLPTSNSKTYLFPAVGMRLNAARLVNISKVSFYISSNYLEYIASEGIDEFLDPESPAGPYGPINSNQLQAKAKRWVSSVAIGGWQNRLVVKASHLAEKKDEPLPIPVATSGGYFYVRVYETLSRKGWSTEMRASIIKQAEKRRNVQAVLFNEEYSLGKNGNPNSVLYYNVYNQTKRQWRGSVKTEVAINCFFAQASALLSFNDYRHNYGSAFEYFNNHDLNFLLAGYKFSFKKAFVKQIEINAQGKNLVLPKQSSSSTYQYRYIGMGLHAAF